MTKHFKVVYGFGQDNFIPIDETELEKAVYAFITGRKVFLKYAAIDGNQISKIIPDYHKTMGWNYTHKLDPNDWSEINRKCGNFTGIVGLVGERINQLIKAGKTELIGTGAIPTIEPNKTGIRSIGEVLA